MSRPPGGRRGARSVFEAESILKSTPPRLSPTALERIRLVEAWQRLRSRTAIVLSAAAGFGKTTLMLQWRRRWLQQDAYVGWLLLDEFDRPARLAQGLLHSLRMATGQAAFQQLAAMCALQPERELEAMTALLAEVAKLGTETVLMLDDFERLPGRAARRLLHYLLLHAPPNLHLVLGSRLPPEFPLAELSGQERLGLLEAAQLRFTESESVEILSHRFGERIDLDQCVRLHDATEGWPIALQLAAATVERGPDLAEGIEGLSGRSGDLGRYFLESLFSNLPDEASQFLVRASIMDRLEANACAMVTGDAQAGERLQWLLRETPVLSESEHGSWLHLHRLARDFLLDRCSQLPASERRELHLRASHWAAAAERYHEAAGHALAAGDLAATQENAARALWILGAQGRVSEARAWLRYIPPRMLAEDVELLLYAAWVLVSGERNAEALATAYAELRRPCSTPRTRMIASRVAGGAAICADRLDILQSLLREWPDAEPHHPLYLFAHANGQALLALHTGASEQAREHAAAAQYAEASPTLSLAVAFSRVLVALSHWQEGNAIRVETLLRPVLRKADFDAGRRGMVPCLVAPMLAAALRELGQPAAARAVLADRLDVIERGGEPDMMLLAFRTLADVALDLGDEGRAVSVLENLEALASRRKLPRLAMQALAAGVRLHAQRGRTETAARLARKLEGMRERFEQADLRPLLPQFELALSLAQAQLALATGEHEQAAARLAAAEALSAGGTRMRERLEAQALKAVLADLRGEATARAQLRVAADLADFGGLRRVLLDAHPGVARLLDRRGPVEEARKAAQPPLAPSPGALLTPKEAQVLVLVGDGLANKSIARALGIGEETVKWHLKNIFGKLHAGSRKHAVGRARLLGLIPEEHARV
jgi:LuxR family maltose regulon positive regulatory protein